MIVWVNYCFSQNRNSNINELCENNEGFLSVKAYDNSLQVLSNVTRHLTSCIEIYIYMYRNIYIY